MGYSIRVITIDCMAPYSSFREVNARGKGGNMGAINAELFPLDLKPVTSPKHALPAALLQVQASDW